MKEDTEDHDIPREAEEIARRALVLHCVISAAHGASRADLIKWLEDEGLWHDVSPLEKAFLESSSPSERDVTNATWRVEAQVVLLWSISKIEDLGSLSEQCDTEPLVGAIPDLFGSTGGFIGSAILREATIIEDEYEKVYDAHWQTRDAVRRGAPIPNDVDTGIVQERHYGFNWITGYCGDGWDQITTDT